MSVNNVIVVSDLHCGCRLGLCPPRIHMDGGGTYEQGAELSGITGRFPVPHGTFASISSTHKINPSIDDPLLSLSAKK